MKEGTFQTFKDTGLRFAGVVADYNPIHLKSWSAKLFGFKRPIAHGMFVAAKVFHEALAVWEAAGGCCGVLLLVAMDWTNRASNLIPD